MDLPFLLFSSVVFLACAVAAAAGFGATVLAVTLGAQILPVPAVLALFVPLDFALSLYLAARHRAHIDRGRLGRRVLPLLGLGMAGGLALGPLREQNWMKAVFAALVAALALVELRRRAAGAGQRPIAPAGRGLALGAAGLVHGIFACGGPLVVYVLSREIEDKRRFRATLAALWVLLDGVFLASYARAGAVTAGTLAQSGALLLPFLAGIAAGEAAHRRLPDRHFHRVILWLLLGAGVSLLVRTLAAAPG